jgi:hypothetical protein
MEMTMIADGNCGANDCSRVFVTERGTVAVQGYSLSDIHVPDGEAVVEVPAALILEAARALGR